MGCVRLLGWRARLLLLVLAVSVCIERSFVVLGALALGRPDNYALSMGVAIVATAVVEQPLRLWIRALAGRAVAERTLRNLLGGDVLPPIAIHEPQTAIADGWWLVMQSLGDWGGEALGSALACVVALGVLVISLSATSLIIACTSAAGMLAGFVVIRRVTHRFTERAWGAQQRVADLVGDALNGRVDIVGGGRADAFLQRCEESLENRQRATRSADFLTSLVGRGPQMILGAAIVLVFFSVHTGGAHELLIVAATLPTFGTLSTSLYQLHRASVRLRPMLHLLSEVPVLTGAPPPEQPDDVALEGVSVTLGRKTVLDGVSWQTRRGEVTILAGANGSGKSTLLHTLAGLAPYRGSLGVGRQELSQLNLARWRERIVFLAQRSYLPGRRSVGYAMKLLEPDASSEELRRALERVGVLERLSRRLADPFEVQVDALSAGERQRVALARALVRDADVYLLDEPDANLDAAGVALVAQLLRELGQSGKIVIVAAHTPQIIASGDRVVHLDGGRVTRVVEVRSEEP